jgi:hypothetical protein
MPISIYSKKHPFINYNLAQIIDKCNVLSKLLTSNEYICINFGYFPIQNNPFYGLSLNMWELFKW